MSRNHSRVAGLLVLLAVAAAPCPAGADGYWGQGDPSPTTGDCDPAIMQRVVAMGRQNADALTALAMNQYQPMPNSFDSMSCLDRLRNSSLNIVFSAPSLDDILNRLAAAACGIARNYATKAIGPSLSSISSPSWAQAASLGQIVPGLGGITGGISVDTGGSGGLLSVNGSQGARNLAGYWGGGDPRAASYGGLFGSGSGAAAAPAAGTSSSWFRGFGLGSLFGGSQ